jgi:peptidoglycan/xylan/chitin deacetylase (PgdA/CDA1 family)
MYHRFPDAAGTLEGQCEHLRRRYCPVTLTQVAQAFASGEALPPNAVAVTVDDGYRDFLLRGYPVFRRFHIVPTVFLVSDFVDGKRWMPGDTLAYALQQTRASTVEFDAPDGAHRTFPITTADGRSIAHRHICDALKGIGEPARRRAFEDLVRTLHVEVPATPTPEFEPLSWEEARRLARDGVEFGAHTRTHPILSQIADRTRLEDEIVWPKARIEAELGATAIHFCYPNGRRQDFTDEAVAIVRTAAFQTAVTTERGLNVASSNPLTLRRLGVDPWIPLPYFEELLAGVRAQ